MAEDKSLNLFDDALLVSEAKSTDRIGLFRKDSSGNNEKTVTAADLAASMAPDYASLSEQAVPGEFWLSMSGNRKQVYLQSFLGTLSKNNTSIYVTLKSSGISTAWIAAMNIRSTQWDIVSNVTGAFLRVDPTTGELAFMISSDSVDNLDGKNYVLTVKFTKQ